MKNKTPTPAKEARLKTKRQRFHQLLLQLGEEKYKELIVNTAFGVDSTTQLTEAQLDQLIRDTEQRIGANRTDARPTVSKQKDNTNDTRIRRLRNKVLLVLAQRGIKATPKDWSAINQELSAKRYQWIMTDEQREQGICNQRGLLTFVTEADLEKLFQQLCRIRDNEKEQKTKIIELSKQN